MYRNGRSISHAGEAAESTTSARSPVASSTKPGNECWLRNRSPRRKTYKRQSIASFKAAWRPGGGPRPSGGQADGRSSSQAVRRRITMEFACGTRSSNWEPPRGARRRFRSSKRGSPQRDLPVRFGWIVPKRRVGTEDVDGERFRTDPSDSLRNLPRRSELNC